MKYRIQLSFLNTEELLRLHFSFISRIVFYFCVYSVCFGPFSHHVRELGRRDEHRAVNPAGRSKLI